MQNLFFNDNAPSHTQCLFSGQLLFHRSYFFRPVSNPSKQLILHISQFDTAATFLEQLSFQSNYFFEAATISEQLLLLSNFFSRTAASLEGSVFKLLFGATSLNQVLLCNIRLCGTATFSTELFLQRRHYFRRAAFSENQQDLGPTFLGGLLLTSAYFLRGAAFTTQFLTRGTI